MYSEVLLSSDDLDRLVNELKNRNVCVTRKPQTKVDLIIAKIYRGKNQRITENYSQMHTT